MPLELLVLAAKDALVITDIQYYLISTLNISSALVAGAEYDI
jgi:hypothetical protein